VIHRGTGCDHLALQLLLVACHVCTCMALRHYTDVPRNEASALRVSGERLRGKGWALAEQRKRKAWLEEEVQMLRKGQKVLGRTGIETRVGSGNRGNALHELIQCCQKILRCVYCLLLPVLHISQ
jgi:hypothetical protein